MTTGWLGSSSFAAFMSTQWRSIPYAESQSATETVGLFTSETVERLLETHGPVDALVVRNGKLLSQHAPRSAADLRDLLGDGCSLVLRHAERTDPALAGLAEAVSVRLDGVVAIQLYVTPKGYHSFGWHYDAEDVLIVQTAGTKEYLIRQNTVNPHPVLAGMPVDQQFEKETSQAVSSCTLEVGDWLYIPSGWWHMARAEQNSLSISIGVLPRQGV